MARPGSFAARCAQRCRSATTTRCSSSCSLIWSCIHRKRLSSGCVSQARPARPQTAQHGLFAAQAPEAGRLEVLLARLRKLVGEGRVGTPELLDSHAPDAFRVVNFDVGEMSLPNGVNAHIAAGNCASALRMVRPPHAVGVELRGNVPSAMHYEGQRLTLQTCSGPWRTSGAWWTHPAWCREEWDVVLEEESAALSAPCP